MTIATHSSSNRLLRAGGVDAVAAKAKVAELLDRLGFATTDPGTLAGGARLQQFPGGSLPTLNLIKIS
jgi:8-hydroxy-5-deazaflavin:NADPH oxidoreductase